MAHGKKNFTQKPKRSMNELDESLDRKSRSSSTIKQPGSSKDKLGKREASRK
jgi:hypothetical protein